jgi:integrase
VNLLRGHVEVRRTIQRTSVGWTFGTPKSVRSTRDLSLPRGLLAQKRDYLDAHPYRANPDAPLWPERTAGASDYDTQFDVASLYRYAFKPALPRLGLPVVRWYELRHYHASACIAAGIEFHKVSRWMGHASISTTDSI